MTFKNKVTNIQPLIPGGTTVVKLGCGPNAPTLDRLQFGLGAGSGTFNTTKVNRIKGFMNGREFYDSGSATQHNKRRAYLGATTLTSELVIDFTEPNARSQIEQNLTCIPLSQLQSCQFELEIDASASATLTLDCIAHLRAPTVNPYVKKRRRITQAFSNAGEQIIYLPEGATGGKLARVWIEEATPGNITAVELRSKNVVGIESSRTKLENSQTDNGLVPQAGIVCLDFIEDGNLAGWFDTERASEVQLKLTATAADAYTVYMEYIDPINRL